MEEQKPTIFPWFVAVFLLIVGLAGGYYYGNAKGLKEGASQEKDAQEARRRDAEKQAAQALNPFDKVSTNPFENATNPFENVKFNPFD